MPALETRRSMGPSSFSVSATMCSTCSRSETSQGTARPPISAATSSIAASLRAETATFMPADASSSAMVRPMPRPPPVTSATWSCSSPSLATAASYASRVAVLGIDVGGTFTDAVLLANGELRTAKVPTARRQEESVLAAVREVEAAAASTDRFTHGTTVATNALLERKGARMAFVATAGFEHMLHLRRQNRAHLYRLCAAHPKPLVPLEIGRA